jgi:hypothetical protein
MNCEPLSYAIHPECSFVLCHACLLSPEQGPNDEWQNQEEKEGNDHTNDDYGPRQVFQPLQRITPPVTSMLFALGMVLRFIDWV